MSDSSILHAQHRDRNPRHPGWAILAILALALGMAPQKGCLTLYGMSIVAPVNTDAATDTVSDIAPRIATDGNRTWISVWLRTAGAGYNISYARMTGNNGTWSAPAPLFTDFNTPAAPERGAVVACDGKGHWIVAWEAVETYDGYPSSIRIVRSNNNGATWTFPAVLFGVHPGDYAVDIATDGAGTWALAFTAAYLDPHVDSDIYVTFSTNNGITWSDPQPVNSDSLDGVGSNVRPHIACDRVGGWFVWWTNVQTDDCDIRFARLVQGSPTWSDPALLAPDEATVTLDDTFGDIAIGETGKAFFVWASSANYLGSGAEGDIFLQDSTDFGATWNAPWAISGDAAATDTNLEKRPAIAHSRYGKWLMAFESHTPNDGSSPDVGSMMGMVSSNGTAWDTTFSLDFGLAAGPARLYPDVAVDRTGYWAIAWHSAVPLATATGTDEDIHYVYCSYDLTDIESDSDGDTIANGVEGSEDFDKDDIPNYLDPDMDGDGLMDAVETASDLDGDTIPNYRDLDSDGDNIGDATEVAAATDPLDPASHPVYCDVNGNNEVNVADLQAVINAVLGVQAAERGDVSIDGEVDAVDIQVLINEILGIH